MLITISCACNTVRIEGERFRFSDGRISYLTDGQWSSVDLEEDYCPECGEAYEYHIE